MAIVFTQDISEVNTLMAFNNNVIKYTTDETVLTVLNSEITIGSETIILYPNPSNEFYFNFKDYIAKYTNNTKFVDSVNPVLNASDIESFTYESRDFLQTTISIQINFTDTTSESDTREVFFLNGVEQLQNYQRNETQSTGQFVFLSPLTPQTNNNYYVKYWEGFPFDVSILRRTETRQFSVRNNTNLLSTVFTARGQITRLFFSDGNTDETIDDFLPIAVGRNVLQMSNNNYDVEDPTPIYENVFLTVDKQTECNEGVYVKWYNNYGGYSYWKFSKFFTQNINVRSLGELNTDFDNLENTYGTSAEIGFNANDRLTVSTDLLSVEEQSLLQSLFTSPKVYLFTGLPYSRASVNDWVEVKKLTNSFPLRNIKSQPVSFSMQFELPDYYTQRL